MSKPAHETADADKAKAKGEADARQPKGHGARGAGKLDFFPKKDMATGGSLRTFGKARADTPIDYCCVQDNGNGSVTVLGHNADNGELQDIAGVATVTPGAFPEDVAVVHVEPAVSTTVAVRPLRVGKTNVVIPIMWNDRAIDPLSIVLPVEVKEVPGQGLGGLVTEFSDPVLR